MTLDEASRLHLFDQARNALGEAAASTLMTALPATSDRLATTGDLDALADRLDARFQVLEANLRQESASRTSDLLRTLFFAMIGSNATLVGLVFAAVRLG